MGTSGTGISSSDLYKDIYHDFFDLYNENKSVTEISAKLISENKEIINDPDESNDFWFALAKAQWDCGSLSAKIMKKAEDIIKSGMDIQRWKNLNASESEIKKREKSLNEFLLLLKSENPKPEKPKIKKYRDSIFEKGDCLSISLDNGKYGAAVVLIEQKNTEYGLNLILVSDYFNDIKIDMKDIKKQKCFIVQYAFEPEPLMIYCYAYQFKKKKYSFEKIGSINIPGQFEHSKRGYLYGHWDMIAMKLNHFYQNTDRIIDLDIKVGEFIEKGITR